MKSKIFGICAFALIVCIAAGCGRRMGDVSGVVTYKDRPLTSGTIQFLAADGVPYFAEIKSDGTYALKVASGEAKVVISCIDEQLAKSIGEKMKSSKGPGSRGKTS